MFVTCRDSGDAALVLESRADGMHLLLVLTGLQSGSRIWKHRAGFRVESRSPKPGARVRPGRPPRTIARRADLDQITQEPQARVAVPRADRQTARDAALAAIGRLIGLGAGEVAAELRHTPRAAVERLAAAAGCRPGDLEAAHA